MTALFPQRGMSAFDWLRFFAFRRCGPNAGENGN
jgi:hypothetical protein